jgi:hypothetical protein
MLHVQAGASIDTADAFALDDQRKRRSAGPLLPVHTHDVGACELPIGGNSSPVAVTTRQKRQLDSDARDGIL